MCAPSTPKVKEPKAKDPAIIRNPFLDGFDKTMRSLRVGRSALRIERGSGRANPAPLPLALPTPTSPSPYIGGAGSSSPSGGGGGGGRNNNVALY